LIFVYGKRQVKFHYSVYDYPVFPAPFIEEVVLSPMYAFGVFAKNELAVAG
jgi:hypothetical protein